MECPDEYDRIKSVLMDNTANGTTLRYIEETQCMDDHINARTFSSLTKSEVAVLKVDADRPTRQLHRYSPYGSNEDSILEAPERKNDSIITLTNNKKQDECRNSEQNVMNANMDAANVKQEIKMSGESNEMNKVSGSEGNLPFNGPSCVTVENNGDIVESYDAIATDNPQLTANVVGTAQKMCKNFFAANSFDSVASSLAFASSSSASTEQLRQMLLLHQKLSFSNYSFSNLTKHHTLSAGDERGKIAYHHSVANSDIGTSDVTSRMALLMSKRLRLARSNRSPHNPDFVKDHSWFINQVRNNDKTRKRKRGASRLDRKQVLRCITCGLLDVRGYKYGDYAECNNCGSNDFVVVREWSPTRDGKLSVGNRMGRSSGSSSEDGHL